MYSRNQAEQDEEGEQVIGLIVQEVGDHSIVPFDQIRKIRQLYVDDDVDYNQTHESHTQHTRLYSHLETIRLKKKVIQFTNGCHFHRIRSKLNISHVRSAIDFTVKIYRNRVND